MKVANCQLFLVSKLLIVASWFTTPRREEEEEEELSACRGEGSVVGPLLAARALPLPGVRARCQYRC
jgi:hypothetical protein